MSSLVFLENVWALSNVSLLFFELHGCFVEKRTKILYSNNRASYIELRPKPVNK